MSRTGDTLNDSHAEVMCRRGLLRYLYEQIERATANENSIFTFNDTTNKFKISSNISFHFFTTHAPCGDASIFSHSLDSDTDLNPKRLKIDALQNVESIGCSVSFTGAKIIYKSMDVAPDLMVQSIGEVRTKPGRGEPTLSISCSDKLAKWNVLGIQGALIYSLLEQPIYLSSITLSNANYCNIDAMQRAIWKRFDGHKYSTSKRFRVNQPTVQLCHDMNFRYEKRSEREPAPGSIVWCKTQKYPLQVAVNGKRLGATKKNSAKISGRLFISKIELLRCYVNILKKCNDKLRLLPNDTDFNVLEYYDAKNIAIDYQTAWMDLKQQYFGIWSTKPNDLNRFTID